MDSLREQIIDVLTARLLAITSGVDGYTETWSAVLRRPPEEKEVDFGAVVRVIEGSERKERRINYYDCFLPIDFEFFYKLKVGDEAPQELNRLLLDIQRAVYSDTRMNDGSDDLAITIRELGSEFDTEVTKPTIVGGVSRWELHYRHLDTDPRLIKS